MYDEWELTTSWILCYLSFYNLFKFQQEIINDLGSENVSSIQKYSTEKGAFKTAGFTQDGLPVGSNFPIVPGDGYLIFTKQDVSDFQ